MEIVIFYLKWYNDEYLKNGGVDMQRFNAFLHRKLDGFTLDEYIIMFVVCSLFLPFYCCLIAIACVLVYLFLKKRLRAIIHETPRANWAIGFCLLTSVVAFVNGNILGGFCAIGILLLLMFIFYYRCIINKRLFELLMDACCIISLFCFAWSIMEYFRIIDRLDYSFIELRVEDNPKDRINSTFFNANYYAMMIEFLVLICIYKMMQVKTMRRTIFYMITIACNLFSLYLTGCRTAWVPFLVTVPFMFLINKRFGYFSLSMGSIASGGVAILINPDLFQRTNIFADFAKRANIWETAIKGIQAHPLLGEGPLTYYHIYPLYHGHPTQHAHSVYLDPFLSHGVIGVLIFAVYLGSNLKQIWHLFTRRIDLRLFSLITACILTVLIHGILDYTVYWIQTGLLFLLILSSSSIYFHKEQRYHQD